MGKYQAQCDACYREHRDSCRISKLKALKLPAASKFCSNENLKGIRDHDAPVSCLSAGVFTQELFLASDSSSEDTLQLFIDCEASKISVCSTLIRRESTVPNFKNASTTPEKILSRKRKCETTKRITLSSIGFMANSHFEKWDGPDVSRHPSDFVKLVPYNTINVTWGRDMQKLKTRILDKHWVQSKADLELPMQDLERDRLGIPESVASRLFAVRTQLQEIERSASPLCANTAQ